MVTKTRGEENLTNDTPPKKGVLDPPSYGTFSTPLRCQYSVFPVQKIHDSADQKLFWRGAKIFGRARSLVRFPPPIRFAPPISRPRTLPWVFIDRHGGLEDPCM